MNDFMPAGSIIKIGKDSSNFNAVYWRGDNTIDILFHSGAVYRYAHVPPSLWEFCERLVSSGSKGSIGKALHAEILSKPDLYPYEKVKQL